MSKENDVKFEARDKVYHITEGRKADKERVGAEKKSKSKKDEE